MNSQSPNTTDQQDRRAATAVEQTKRAYGAGPVLGFTAFLAVAALLAALSPAPHTAAAPGSLVDADDLPADECEELWDEFWECQLTGGDDCVMPDCLDAPAAEKPLDDG